MAVLRVDDFKGKLSGGGARANMFNVMCEFPGYAGGDKELTSFMCRGAQVPGSTIAAIDVPFRGRIVKLAGDRSFADWTVTIYNDTNFSVRDAFENWMDGMNSHQGNLGTFANDAGSTYATDWDVEHLDQTGAVIKTYKLRNAFPVDLSTIELAYDQASEIETFTVTIAYDYWTSNTTS